MQSSSDKPFISAAVSRPHFSGSQTARPGDNTFIPAAVSQPPFQGSVVGQPTQVNTLNTADRIHALTQTMPFQIQPSAPSAFQHANQPGQNQMRMASVPQFVPASVPPPSFPAHLPPPSRHTMQQIPTRSAPGVGQGQVQGQGPFIPATSHRK